MLIPIPKVLRKRFGRVSNLKLTFGCLCQQFIVTILWHDSLGLMPPFGGEKKRKENAVERTNSIKRLKEEESMKHNRLLAQSCLQNAEVRANHVFLVPPNE